MKQIINGKTYNTDTMTTLVKRSAYNNGNYAGSDSVRVTANGNYAFVSLSNGQDLYRSSNIEEITKDQIPALIDGWELDDSEAKALADHGITTDA